MTVRVVRAEGYSPADEDMLLRETSKRLGEDMEIRVEHALATTSYHDGEATPCRL